MPPSCRGVRPGRPLWQPLRGPWLRGSGQAAIGRLLAPHRSENWLYPSVDARRSLGMPRSQTGIRPLSSLQIRPGAAQMQRECRSRHVVADLLRAKRHSRGSCHQKWRHWAASICRKDQYSGIGSLRSATRTGAPHNGREAVERGPHARRELLHLTEVGSGCSVSQPAFLRQLASCVALGMALAFICTIVVCLIVFVSPAASSSIVGITAASLQTAKDFSVR